MGQVEFICHDGTDRHELDVDVREWWLRTVLVLTAPSAVFAALRDDSRETASKRAEPVLLIVWLAGIAFVLSTADGGAPDGRPRLRRAARRGLDVPRRRALRRVRLLRPRRCAPRRRRRRSARRGRTGAPATCSPSPPSRSRCRSLSGRSSSRSGATRSSAAAAPTPAAAGGSSRLLDLALLALVGLPARDRRPRRARLDAGARGRSPRPPLRPSSSRRCVVL